MSNTVNITTENLYERKSTDIFLVNVPLGVLKSPSLALGILKSVARQSGLSAEVLYANLMFIKYIGIDDYRIINNWAFATVDLIEIIFQPYAGYESFASLEEIEKFYVGVYPSFTKTFPCFREAVKRAWKVMDRYLDDVCDRILKNNPKIVGCSYGIQQANASLAILKRVKEKNPSVITVIGGSCCSEYAGQAIVDYMPQVDYVFCGESDDIFSDALKLMIDGNKEELRKNYKFVLMKGGIPHTHALQDMDTIPYSDFDDYFDQIKEFGLEEENNIVLPIESSRGCWWGYIKKCNFCGIHNSQDSLRYRKKSITHTVNELEYLSSRYGIKDFMFTDCILDNQDIKELPNLIGDKGYSCFAEVKTNMTLEEMEGLKKAGFIWFTPGIESLQDDLLIHMNKGNRAIKHVEFLKWATQVGIFCFWNMLVGFPKEKIEWYEETMELMPLIHHLNPPQKNTFIYQKNSYYTTHSDEYGVKLYKADFYEYFFGKNNEFLEKFAEFFYDPTREIPYEEKIENAIACWRKAWERGTVVTYFVDDDYMGIFDNRDCAVNQREVLTGIKKQICEAADKVIKIKKLMTVLDDYSEEEIYRNIEELKESKLIIQIKDEILFLALNKEKICREDSKTYRIGLVDA